MKLEEINKTTQDSNLAIKWKPSSPSSIAFFKRIGISGDKFEDADVENNDIEIWFVKVDGKRYRISDDMKSFKED